MEKIASFTIDHLRLLPGLYLSRRDEKDGVTVTTFDLRFTAPNREPAMDIAGLHTVEHLFATYLRNSEIKDDVVYFGPMGCRTGCYLLLFGDKTPEEALPYVLGACDFTLAFEGDIPGGTGSRMRQLAGTQPVPCEVLCRALQVRPSRAPSFLVSRISRILKTPKHRVYIRKTPSETAFLFFALSSSVCGRRHYPFAAIRVLLKTRGVGSVLPCGGGRRGRKSPRASAAENRASAAEKTIEKPRP